MRLTFFFQFHDWKTIMLMSRIRRSDSLNDNQLDNEIDEGFQTLYETFRILTTFKNPVTLSSTMHTAMLFFCTMLKSNLLVQLPVMQCNQYPK